MREQIGAEDPSKGGRDAPNRLGWHRGTPTFGRKAAASGAAEVVELPTNSSDGGGSRTGDLAGCERRGHDHENLPA